MSNKLKANIKPTFTVFKGELFLNFPIWIIQIIACTTFLFSTLSVCFSETAYESINSFGIGYLKFFSFNSVADMFVNTYVNLLAGIGTIFTIIYAAKSFSYLHNKCKLDLYGSIPMTRKQFFNSKLFASFMQSTMIVFVFFIIAVIIGLFTGASFSNNEIQLLFIYLFFTLFTVTFYGLCATCAKSTVSAIISYFIIEITIPMVVTMAKMIITGFFVGVNPYVIPDNIIGHIFSPSSNTSFVYVIVWLVLSVGCIALSNKIVKTRNPENTHKMLSAPLLEYIIKISLTIIIGTFVGLFNGGIYENHGSLGFILGFLLAGISTYIIIHIIYNKGFKHIITNSIVLTVLMIAGIGLFLLCDMNPMNFNNNVPNAENVVSAGIVRTSHLDANPNAHITMDSIGDFTNSEDIEKIVKFHKEIANGQPNYITSEKCQKVFGNYFADAVFNVLDIYGNNAMYSEGFIISYKYANGSVGTFYYPANNYDAPYYSVYDSKKACDLLAEIEVTDTYAKKYRPLFNNSNEIYSIEIHGLANFEDAYGAESYEDFYGYEYYEETPELAPYSTYFSIPGVDYEYKKYMEFCKELTEAFKKDFENDKTREQNSKPLPSLLDLGYVYGPNNENMVEKYVINFSYESDNNLYGFANDYYYIPKTYTETIKVLKDYYIINEDFTINTYSPFL